VVGWLFGDGRTVCSADVDAELDEALTWPEYVLVLAERGVTAPQFGGDVEAARNALLDYLIDCDSAWPRTYGDLFPDPDAMDEGDLWEDAGWKREETCPRCGRNLGEAAWEVVP